MKIFNLLTMILFKLNQKNTEKTFKIVAPLEQVVKVISETNIDDNAFYNNTLKYEIINHLNFEEVDALMKKIEDVQKKEMILKIILNEKYRWDSKIIERYNNEIKNSRISLNTTDFIALCIGKKVDLQELKNNSLCQNICEDIDYSINQYLIRAKTTSFFETSQRLGITVNQGLALFFCFDKKIAITKFKRIIDYDRKYRPYASQEAEYFEAVRLFFDRLKLDFIPQIDFTNSKSLIEYKNNNKKYVTQEEIQLIIDQENYFNKSPIFKDIKKIISPKHILNIEIFKSCLFMFFENIDKNITTKDIDIFVATLTEINSSFDDNEMKSIQIKLNSFLMNKEDRINFIVLMDYFRNTYFLKVTTNKLSKLLSLYFNKIDGIGESNIKDFFYHREGRKTFDYTKTIKESIKNKIDNSVKKK